MSLARTLMNGGSFGTSIDPSKYTHDMGATRIAMESVEELHEIFIESFYNVEQAELAAATEGVDLVGSDYEVVAEGAIGNAFTKIKDFLKKLWDKVKAWFHQVKRFLDSLFMSGKDFVKKYKKDIEIANRTLKDFSFTMYEYEDDKIDKVSKDVDIDAMSTEIYNKSLTLSINKSVEDMKKAVDEDQLAKDFADEVLNGSKVKVNGKEDLGDAFFAFFRNGATSKEDKEDIDITDLGHYADILEKSTASKEIDSMSTKTDKAYKTAIKRVDELEKFRKDRLEDSKEADDKDTKAGKARISSDQRDIKLAQEMSTGLSRLQSIHNQFMGVWKSVIKERDTVYKQLIVAGLSNAKKNAKNK